MSKLKVYVEQGFDEYKVCLNLSKHELECQDMGAVIASIEQAKELKLLDLSVNLIDSQGIQHLMLALDFSDVKLQKLDLSENMVGPKSMDAVGKYVRNNTELQCLALRRAFIGNKGLRILSNYVEKHPCLTSIDIRDNNINDAAMTDFLLTLKKTQVPRIIDCLQGNNLSDQMILSCDSVEMA